MPHIGLCSFLDSELADLFILKRVTMRYTHCLDVPLSVNVGNDVNVARNIFIDHIVRCFSSEILKLHFFGVLAKNRHTSKDNN